MNKKMKIFISLSVLLNILLVGFLLGGVVGLNKNHSSASGMHSKYTMSHGAFYKNHHAASMDQRINHIIAALPAEKSELFKQQIVQLKALKHDHKSQMRAARKQILQAFEKEPFDKTSYQQAVKNLNALHHQQMELRVNIMADVAEYLSPEERKKLSYLIMPKKGRK